MAYAERGSVTALDAASGEVLYRKPREDDSVSLEPVAPGVVAFSPDGNLAAISLVEPAVRILDAESGEEQFRLEGGARPVTCIAFSPDGKWIAASDADGLIRVWDVTSRQCRHTWSSGGGVIWEVFFLGDGPERMAAVTEGSVLAARNKLVDPRRLAYGFGGETENGKLFVIAVNDTAPAGKAGLRVGDRVLESAGEPVSTMDDVRATLDDAKPGESLVLTIERDSRRIDLEIVPGTAQDLGIARYWLPRRGQTENLHVLDVTTREVRFTKQVVTRSVSCRGGRLAVVVGRFSAQAFGRWQVLDSETGDTLRRFSAPDVVLGRDGTTVLIGGANSLRIVDLESGKTLRTLADRCGRVTAAAWSPDERLVAAVTISGLMILDAESGKAVGRYSLPGQGGSDVRIAFSTDGKYLAHHNTFAPTRLIVWNLARLQTKRRGTVVADDLGVVGRFALSPTGKHFAAAIHESETDGPSKFVVGSVSTGQYHEFVFPDETHFGGEIAFRREGGSTRVVDGSSGAIIRDVGPSELGTHAGFSDDGRYLLVARGSSSSLIASYGAPVVSIVDMETGEVLSRYAPRRAVPSPRRFSFNAAGTRLAIYESGSSDLAVVDVESGRELIHLPHESPLVGVGFHPDGNRLYTATRDGTLPRMWQVCHVSPAGTGICPSESYNAHGG